MDDLTRTMEQARADVGTRWTEDRARSVAVGMVRRRRRRTTVRALGLGAAVALVAALALRHHGGTVADPGAALRLDDGSTATPLGAGARLHWVQRANGRAVVVLDQGGARFDVTHDPARVYRVEAGDVAVQVLGTTFTVERQGARARVAVASGRVRVSWGHRYADLGSGEGDWFPRADALPTPAPAPTAEATTDTTAATATHPRAVHPVPTPSPTPSPTPGDLRAGVLVLREQGRYAEAADVLRSLVAHGHPGVQAQSDAQDLGGLLHDRLRDPRGAADAFARAQELAPDGPLAHDALFREVQCRAEAGETARAHALAREFLQRYPADPAAERVRQWGGGE